MRYKVCELYDILDCLGGYFGQCSIRNNRRIIQQVAFS